jgi:uncharacterized Fe-S radical SAM superfamily protein PflX
MSIAKHANSIVHDLDKYGYEFTSEHLVDALAIAVVDLKVRNDERARKLEETKQYFKSLLSNAATSVAVHEAKKRSEVEECIKAGTDVEAEPKAPKKAA